jgi:RHS repeat-associated protein
MQSSTKARRRGHAAGWFQHKAVVGAINLILLAPLLAWHAPASAQDCQDANEGANEEAAPDYQQEEPDGEGDPFEQDGTLGMQRWDDGGDDGGDSNDGGGDTGDPGGTDGSGADPQSPAEWQSYHEFGGHGLLDLPVDHREALRENESDHSVYFNVIGDPIDVRLADKRHVQIDYSARGPAALRMARVYHSNASVNAARVTVPIGNGWHMFFDRSVQALSASQVRLHRANGRTLDFSFGGGIWTSLMPAGVLTQVAGGWQYVNHRNVVETYDTNGRLSSLAAGGLVTSLQYDGAGRLAAVVNPFGRRLGLAYDPAGRVGAVTLPDGNTMGYSYDARGNLTATRFADNSTRQYLYENASFPSALTGLVDETGRRRVTWGYDAQGRPNQSYFGTGVGTVNVGYNGSQVTTTDSRGASRTRSYSSAGGRVVLAAIQTAATTDSAATSWSFNYDANGNPLSVTTRTGELRQFAHDGRGRLMTQTRAAGTAQASSSQTTWHPTFRVPTRKVSFGVTRDYTVDAAGRVSQVSETSGTTTRTVGTIVYNGQNLPQSITDARGATTTFTYDASGNRTSATNALGQTTYYQNHNAHGQAARVQRADGVVLTKTFDTRGRILIRSIAGLTTSYEYDAAGRVAKITAPDGGWRTFSYDAAGMRAGSTNHRSESTTLARDAAGVVLSRSVYSSAGARTGAQSRRVDTVGRVSALVDSRNYFTRFLYGSDGRPSGTVDPLNLSRTVQLDPLDRPTTVVVPNTTAMRQAGGAATASIAHSYDGIGNHKTTIDTNTIATGYAYDPFNRRNGEAGNDAGSVGVVRNAAGDITSITDARGITLTRTIDALGRLSTTSSGGAAVVQYNYVPGRGDGLLSSMSDPAGSTSWTYDGAGRMLTQTQTVQGIQKVVSITRDTIGRPSNITYPSGMQVGITYAGDVVSSLTVNGATLLDNIGYRPFSQVATGWRWGNGTNYSRAFDADGRVTSVSLGSVQRTYAYDPAGRISSQTDTGAQGTKISTYGYDEAGQLSSYTPPTGTAQTFGYDANGNRRTESVAGVSRTYTYLAGSNRLSSVSGGLRSYQYNSDGHASTDGRFSFVYDIQGRLAAANTATQKVNSLYNGYGLRTYKTVSQYSDGIIPTAIQPTSSQQSTKIPPAVVTAATGTWVTTAKVQFVYDQQGRLLGEYNSIGGTTQETIWFNDQPVATRINGVLHYVNADNLGTPRSIVRASDNVELWRWDSDPFGIAVPTAPNIAAGVVKYNLRFPGQYFDSETGLHYNGMRDYDPRTGRYAQSDPIGLAGGLGRYTYAMADPNRFVDPTGLLYVAIPNLYSQPDGYLVFHRNSGDGLPTYVGNVKITNIQCQIACFIKDEDWEAAKKREEDRQRASCKGP